MATHKVEIDAITGPGKRVLFVGEIKEISFNFDKKIVGVFTKDGNFGTYDMEGVDLISFKREEMNFTITIKQEHDDDAKRAAADDERARIKATPTTGTSKPPEPTTGKRT